MSIINQVLKDLDQQRGPNDGLEVAVLQGVGLVSGERTLNWPFIALAAGVVAALALGYQQVFSSAPTHSYQAAPGLQAEIAESHSTGQPVAQPEESAHQPAVIGQVKAPAETPDLASEMAEPPVLLEQPAQRFAEPEIEKPPVPEGNPAPEPVVKTLSARQKADHAFASAQRALENHDVKSAEQRFQETLSLYPQHLAARQQLAGIYLNTDQQARAAALLEDGLALNGAKPQLAHLYAQLLASRGQLNEALQLLAPFSDADSLALSAAIHARLNRHAEAAILYTRALKLDASHGNWWLGLGLSLEQQGLIPRARQAYERAGDLPLAENVRTFVTKRIHSLDKLAGGN